MLIDNDMFGTHYCFYFDIELICFTLFIVKKRKSN